MSKSDRIDNCRSKAAVGAGLTISDNFCLPEWKAAFTFRKSDVTKYKKRYKMLDVS